MMMFRAIQGFSVGTLLFLWAARSLMHPGRFHPTLLIMAAVLALVSEVSYRAGRAEGAKVKR